MRWLYSCFLVSFSGLNNMLKRNNPNPSQGLPNSKKQCVTSTVDQVTNVGDVISEYKMTAMSLMPKIPKKFKQTLTDQYDSDVDELCDPDAIVEDEDTDLYGKFLDDTKLYDLQWTPFLSKHSRNFDTVNMEHSALLSLFLNAFLHFHL